MRGIIDRSTERALHSTDSCHHEGETARQIRVVAELEDFRRLFLRRMDH